MEAVILHARRRWDYLFKVSWENFFQARILKSVKSLLSCSVMRLQSQRTQCGRWGREGPGGKLCSRAREEQTQTEAGSLMVLGQRLQNQERGKTQQNTRYHRVHEGNNWRWKKNTEKENKKLYKKRKGIPGIRLTSKVGMLHTNCNGE